MSDPLPLLAHETWFVPDPAGTDWTFATQSLTLVLLLGAVLATLLVRAANARWSGLHIPFLARMAPFMPFAVRIHLAVSLIGLLSLGFFLSPAMDLQDDVVGILLGAVMAVVAMHLPLAGTRDPLRGFSSPPDRSGCSSSASGRSPSGSTSSGWPPSFSSPARGGGRQTTSSSVPTSRARRPPDRRSGLCGWRPASP